MAAVPTRWGIAGCGKISSDFATALQHQGSAKHVIVAAAARTKDSAQKFALKFGARKFYDQYEALADDPEIDVVYIGVINTGHFEIAKRMLLARKPVLCEKPMCMNLAETQELVTLANKQKTFLMEGVWSRHFPVYREMQARLDGAELGQLTHAFVAFGVPIAQVPIVRLKEYGGGSMSAIGIYALQFILLVFGGDRPLELKAIGSLNEEGVEEEVAVVMRFSHDRFGTFIVSTNSLLPNQAHVTGTKGTIKMDQFWSPTKLSSPSGDFESPLDASDLEYIFPNSQGLKYEADEVARCLREGHLESPRMPLSDSLLLAELMQTVREQVGVKL